MQRKAIPSLHSWNLYFLHHQYKRASPIFFHLNVKIIVIILEGLQLVKWPGTLSPSGPLQITRPPCDNALRQQALLCCPRLAVGRRHILQSHCPNTSDCYYQQPGLEQSWPGAPGSAWDFLLGRSCWELDIVQQESKAWTHHPIQLS